MCGDALALLGALVLAAAMRFDGLNLARGYSSEIRSHMLSALATLVLYIGIFAIFRLYRYAWRFAGLQTLQGVIFANSAGVAVLFGMQMAIDHRSFPPNTLVLFWMLSIAFVGGVRIILRLASIGQLYGGRAVRILQQDLCPKRVVILDGGSNGARVLSAIREDPDLRYEVIGFLDDRPSKQGIYIRDARVLGPLSHLHKLLADRAVDEVLIALPEASGKEIREYVMACRKNRIPVRIIPALRDVLNGNGHPHFEEISVDDLLRRPPVRTDLTKIGSYITGKRVLVTGAGGSIGSELCRQIIARNPASLILLGHGENSIHRICQELHGLWPAAPEKLHMVIASVADETRMNQVFGRHQPHVVFHAAAHKHVPIMEENVIEAVKNNVLGTNCVADACGRFGVERMVLISSDKAVYPCCVMGATKWLSEEVLRGCVPVHPRTTYVTVRFGNVLGSRGSVVPIFHEQIKQGGPVTITHPEMTRYFMSIPEAVALVLQAGAIGGTGELLVLDMGQPVKIMDLACDMIRLCGYEPGKDIEVVFSGIRPGERLHEQLTMDDEWRQAASCEGMSVISRPGYRTEAELLVVMRNLRQLAERATEEMMYRLPHRSGPGLRGRPSRSRLARSKTKRAGGAVG